MVKIETWIIFLIGFVCGVIIGAIGLFYMVIQGGGDILTSVQKADYELMKKAYREDKFGK